VDDSVLQSNLSKSFIRTVQDWERIRQSRGKSQIVATTTLPQASTAAAAAARKPSAGVSASVDGRPRDREKSRQRVEKELGKLAKKEQKLEEEMRRLASSRSKLEAQLESSSASERGRGDSDRDERFLAALDLLDDDGSDSVSEHRSRSKSTRLRRQSCMTSSPGFQRATSVGDPRRAQTNRKSLSAAGPRPDIVCSADDTVVTERDSNSQRTTESPVLSPP